MLQIGVFLAVGLPIACLLGLLGGIDPRSIAYAYGGTVSTAFFLAALSLLVSVYARRPRGAILLVYLIEAVWLLGPWIAYVAMLMGGAAMAWGSRVGERLDLADDSAIAGYSRDALGLGWPRADRVVAGNVESECAGGSDTWLERARGPLPCRWSR